jgi:aspartate/methionine/tyrosine aminotransferase
VDELPPSGIRAFFDLVLGMDDVISLGVGEPDFVTPWHICEAAMFALEKGYTSYTSNRGLKELLEQISSYLKKERKVDYNPNTEILVTVGVSEAMDLLMRAILNAGDEVIIPEPCYVSYIPTVKLAGGNPVILPTWELPGFKVTAEEIKKRITPKTRALVLNYPSNPTGASYTKDELEKIAEVIIEKNILLISDEIYEHIIYDGFAQLSPAELSPEIKAHCIILNGVSKSYSMTGWRIGFTAGPAPLIAAMTKIQSQSTSNPTSISQMAAIEAYNGPQDYVVNVLTDFSERRAFIIKALNDIPGVSCLNPQGAFYAFPNVEGLIGKSCNGKKIDSSLTLCEVLLDEAKIAAVPGEAFGAPGYMRLSYATSMENIIKGIKRLEEFVKELS